MPLTVVKVSLTAIETSLTNSKVFLTNVETSLTVTEMPLTAMKTSLTGLEIHLTGAQKPLREFFLALTINIKLPILVFTGVFAVHNVKIRLFLC